MYAALARALLSYARTFRGRSSMLRRTLCIVLLTGCSWASNAQVPKSELAKPPASATHYIVQSTAGPHGESWVWTTSDGARAARESMNLRGQVWEMDSIAR